MENKLINKSSHPRINKSASYEVNTLKNPNDSSPKESDESSNEENKKIETKPKISHLDNIIEEYINIR
jgi:hypothetical protein